MRFINTHDNGNDSGPVSTVRNGKCAIFVTMLATVFVMGIRLGVVDFSSVRRTTMLSQESQNRLRPTNSRLNKLDENAQRSMYHFCTDDKLASKSADVSEAAQYDWLGNQWFPRKGIPRYTPDDMRDLLNGENVLFVGDSTARQDYATMFNLMNAASHQQDITADDLNHGININKRRKTENCTLRSTEFDDMLSVCRQIPPSRDQETKSSRRDSSSMTTSIATRGTGAFDLSTNPQPCNCFSNIPDFVETFHGIISQQYTVLIFSLGIWESVKANACPDSGLPALIGALDFLKGFSDANPSTLVVWKTHGGGELETMEERQFTIDIRNRTREWFRSNQPKNLVLVDFGSQVMPRTYDDERIDGDSHNHFGLDARLLSLQMIVHGIATKRCAS